MGNKLNHAIGYALFTLMIVLAVMAISVLVIISPAKDKEKPEVTEELPIIYLDVDEPIKEPVISYSLSYEVKEKVTYLGEFKLTAYCSCAKCCGKWASDRPKDCDGNEIVIGCTGNVLTSNYSIAVDPTVIPYGTTLIIDGQEYKAEDCGEAIKGNRIDVYFNDHTEALAFGVQVANVYLKEVRE